MALNVQEELSSETMFCIYGADYPNMMMSLAQTTPVMRNGMKHQRTQHTTCAHDPSCQFHPSPLFGHPPLRSPASFPFGHPPIPSGPHKSPSGTPPHPVGQPPLPSATPPPPVWPLPSAPSCPPLLSLSRLATTSFPTSPFAPHPVSPHVWPPPDCQAHLLPHKVNGWLNIYRFYLFSYVQTCRKSALQFDNIC
jgi:hypothetical protein